MKKYTQNAYARLAGLSYIVVILLGFFSVNINKVSLSSVNNAQPFASIVSDETLFRISFTGEVVMYLLVIVLVYSLFVVLKEIDKNIAFMAMLFRLTEAVLGVATTIFSGTIPLLFIKNPEAFHSIEFQNLFRLFLDVRGAGLDIVLMFIGVGGTLFCWLFYKSNYVPKILAGWGIFTYLSMLILSIASLLSPSISESIKMIFFAPGGLFELVFGLRLLVKGIKISPDK